MYACAILLRNCGHYTMVRSDLGSEYATSRHLSEESLYAGMTRQETKLFGKIEPDMDSTFANAYDIPSRPIWFTPGVFVDEELNVKEVVQTGRHKYNVIDEAVPSTNRSTIMDKKGQLLLKDRNNMATFGSIESVAPDQTALTIGVSPNKELLDDFRVQDVFLMGKKRTMFEVLHVTKSTLLHEEQMQETLPVQVQMHQLSEFYSYAIHDVNARYFLVSGKGLKVWRMQVDWEGRTWTKYLPDVFLEKAALLFQSNRK